MTPRASLDPAALYAACQHADLSTREAAFQTLWDYLFRLVLRVVWDQPDAESLAQDCTQEALVRINARLAECHSPNTFLSWARQIASHLAIDELRRGRRLVPLEDPESETEPAHDYASPEDTPETASLKNALDSNLRSLLQHAPMSERSRRVVVGRYMDDLPDEYLARIESDLAGQAVLPSHVQVTRTKDIARLRGYRPLQEFLLGEAGGKIEKAGSVS